MSSFFIKIVRFEPFCTIQFRLDLSQTLTSQFPKFNGAPTALELYFPSAPEQSTFTTQTENFSSNFAAWYRVKKLLPSPGTLKNFIFKRATEKDLRLDTHPAKYKSWIAKKITPQN